MKFSIKLLTILAIILTIISVVLFISKEYIGGIVTGILFIVILAIIMWFNKMKKDLEIKAQEYSNLSNKNLRGKNGKVSQFN